MAAVDRWHKVRHRPRAPPGVQLFDQPGGAPSRNASWLGSVTLGHQLVQHRVADRQVHRRLLARQIQRLDGDDGVLSHFFILSGAWLRPICLRLTPLGAANFNYCAELILRDGPCRHSRIPSATVVICKPRRRCGVFVCLEMHDLLHLEK